MGTLQCACIWCTFKNSTKKQTNLKGAVTSSRLSPQSRFKLILHMYCMCCKLWQLWHSLYLVTAITETLSINANMFSCTCTKVMKNVKVEIFYASRGIFPFWTFFDIKLQMLIYCYLFIIDHFFAHAFLKMWILDCIGVQIKHRFRWGVNPFLLACQ